jgi:hypothetical protein
VPNPGGVPLLRTLLTAGHTAPARMARFGALGGGPREGKGAHIRPAARPTRRAYYYKAIKPNVHYVPFWKESPVEILDGLAWAKVGTGVQCAVRGPGPGPLYP